MMKVVSYTRTTTCRPGQTENPPDIISLQNRHISEYARDHGWKISEKYSDRKNDSDENAAFEKMLRDGMQRKFDAVIVDSVFRAGKDLWNAKEVLLQTFQYAAIAFVVVEDDFDGTIRTCEEAETYFREKYKIYRQEQLRHQVQERNRRGLICWNDLNYGYQLSDDHTQLVIDKETAPVVKRIFTMYADGASVGEIVKKLTEDRIPKPKVAKSTQAKVIDPYIWSMLTVNRLLGKTVYAGYWEKTIYGVKHEFTNEPIVSRELFERVQRIREANESLKQKRSITEPNRYAGLVCDSKEGFCLHLRKLKNGLEYFVYARDQRGKGDGRHVLVSDVDAAVRNALDQSKKEAVRIAARIQKEGFRFTERKILQMEQRYRDHALLIAEQEKERVEDQRKFAAGQISEEDLRRTEETNISLIQSMEKEFLSFPPEVEKIKKAYSKKNPWLVLMLSWDPDLPLEKDILNRYVSRIELDQLRTITVLLKGQEWHQELPEEWRDTYNGEKKPETEPPGRASD